MVHLHIHLDARAWGNDGLEQIRSARAFAQLGAHRSAPARPVIGWAPTLDPLVLCPASLPVAPLRYRVS